MTSKVKEKSPQILSAIKDAKSILLHFHPSPDGDTVGAALAFYHALKKMGKSVAVIRGDSETPPTFNHLPGIEQVERKNYLETDLSKFDLFIICDSSSLNQISAKGEVKFPENLKTIVIDHHISNIEFGDINLVDENYIATCEIIYDLFKVWEVEITPEIARALFAGLYWDSGGFKYERTDENTFQAAAELVRTYPDFAKDIFEMENNNTSERVKFLGLALTNIHTYFGGKVAIAEVPQSLLKENNLGYEHTEKSDVPNILKSVTYWEIGILMVETEGGKVGVNFRTRDPEKYDLAKIASTLGGGGHKAAAGAPIVGTFEEAKQKLLDIISELHPDLGKI